MYIRELAIVDLRLIIVIKSNTYITVRVYLQERKPELTYEIMAFRDYLLSSTVSDTLDVWELKGIAVTFSFCDD